MPRQSCLLNDHAPSAMLSAHMPQLSMRRSAEEAHQEFCELQQEMDARHKAERETRESQLEWLKSLLVPDTITMRIQSQLAANNAGPDSDWYQIWASILLTHRLRLDHSLCSS